MAQAEKVYFCTIYVHKKHNRSGSTSVVVVSKASGKYKEIKSFGSSISKEGIDSLCEQAATCIRSFGYQQELDFDDRKGKEVEETKRILCFYPKLSIGLTLCLTFSNLSLYVRYVLGLYNVLFLTSATMILISLFFTLFKATSGFFPRLISLL